MAKTTKHQTFTFVDENGHTYSVDCYTTSTRVRVTEHAECDGYHGKSYWYNRPWYRFTYENALYDLASKMAGKNAERLKAFKMCIDNQAQSEREASELWFNNFKKRYDNLSDKTKQHLANACPHITSTEQAESIMQVSEAFDAMFKLQEN